MLALIVAMDRNRAIGKNNALPWHLPADLAHFKRLTTGHTIIMGRKTFESIGRPLPRRRNWVLTRDPHWQATGVEVFHDVGALLNTIQQAPEQQFWGIGGAECYQLLLPYASRLEVTAIDTVVVDADTFFPGIPSAFKLTKSVGEADADLVFEFQTYLA
jgi:dihydrofolate reductase